MPRGKPSATPYTAGRYEFATATSGERVLYPHGARVVGLSEADEAFLASAPKMHRLLRDVAAAHQSGDPAKLERLLARVRRFADNFEPAAANEAA